MFRLATIIGCTVAELRRRMTQAELLEWMAFDALEPIGFRRDDFHAAHIAQAVANSVGARVTQEQAMPFDERRFESNNSREFIEMSVDDFRAISTRLKKGKG